MYDTLPMWLFIPLVIVLWGLVVWIKWRDYYRHKQLVVAESVALADLERAEAHSSLVDKTIPLVLGIYPDDTPLFDDMLIERILAAPNDATFNNLYLARTEGMDSL